MPCHKIKILTPQGYGNRTPGKDIWKKQSWTFLVELKRWRNSMVTIVYATCGARKHQSTACRKSVQPLSALCPTWELRDLWRHQHGRRWRWVLLLFCYIRCVSDVVKLSANWMRSIAQHLSLVCSVDRPLRSFIWSFICSYTRNLSKKTTNDKQVW